ncbi:MAG: hypothetical protein ACRECW_09745 [Phyllobacterium sp.]
MRKIMIAAAVAAFPLASVAHAQNAPAAQPPATQPPAASQQAPSGEVPGQAPAIQSITIVDMEELPEATRTQIDTAIKQRSDADVKQLRSSIDSSPEVSAALKEKGMTSAHVVIASLDSKGLLTLVTKKSG